MNWTEGNLYRHNRGRLRKANPARQRQKEYFARARARQVEQKATQENCPPPTPFLQQSSSPTSRRSRASNKSASSSVRRGSRTPSQRRPESDRKRLRAASQTEDTPLPTISRFFQEQSNRGDAGRPRPEYDEDALERMRQKLLAKKD
ncbi:hypothetical protein N0V88_002411 [Collariella sp. IMI 366227]|nr:hypothetical protein N0V88_002411 [Collariella sp. IMI 366227]